MHRLASAGLTASLCDAVSALALPPPSYALVPSAWGSTMAASYVPPSVPPELEIALWADDTVDLTGSTLYGAMMRAFTFSDITVTPTVVKATLALTGHTSAHLDNTIRAKVPGFGGNGFTFATAQMAGAGVGILTHVGKSYLFTFENGVTTQGNMNTAITASADLEVATAGTTATVLATGTDVFTAVALAGGSAVMHSVAHGLLTGDGSFLQTAATSFPTGLDGVTPYWAIVNDADNYELASSLTNALSGIPVDFATAGVGAQKSTATAATQRVHWHSMGLLGLAADGAIDMDAQASYWDVRRHSPETVAYAVVATFASGSGKVSGQIRPRVDG